ncbi:MAG TPA: DUF2505 family protein [Acidimicrobiales bacterium]|nr:DUF2505 family protein [Acidimicrobiales bacterium]
MRFTAEHRFGGPVDAVVALLTDPEFHRELQLPDLSLPEVVAADVDGDDAHLQLRYEFVGSLDPIASRLLGGRKLTWLQDLDLDRSTGKGRLRFAAEAEPKRLHGKADFTVAPVDGDAGASVRRLTGELKVGVFGVGSMAEGRIVPGLRRRLDIEATELDRRLTSAD